MMVVSVDEYVDNNGKHSKKKKHNLEEDINIMLIPRLTTSEAY